MDGFFFLSFFFFFSFFYYCLSTVVSVFPPPLSPTPPTPTSHPQLFPCWALSMGPLYMFLDDPSLSFSCYLPTPSPLVTVSLFFISMSLVIRMVYRMICRAITYFQVKSTILYSLRKIERNTFHCHHGVCSTYLRTNGGKRTDGGVGRHTVPPRTTRTDRKSNSKEVWHQGDKKETYIQTGRRGRDWHWAERTRVVLAGPRLAECEMKGAGSLTTTRPCGPTFPHR